MSEEELWLELYKLISNKNNHCSIEIINNNWQKVSIKISRTYVVANWYSDEDEWQTEYILGVGNTFKEQLDNVINKINNNDWL